MNATFPYLSAEGVPMAQPLFQEEGDGSTPISALQLHFEETDPKTAAQLNALWHSRLPAFPLATARSNRCFVAKFANRFYAVAIWTPPVARMLNGRGWFELRRMAISPEAPKNTASRMLGHMTRVIRREMPEICKLISYQDCDVHTGTIYKASGWKVPEGYISRPRTWSDWRNRPKRTEQGLAARKRWELELRPAISEGHEQSGPESPDNLGTLATELIKDPTSPLPSTTKTKGTGEESST